MPGERFVGPEKHDSKYDRIKGLVPTPTDDRKELKRMKKEVGNIISDVKKKIKAVPSLADIKDGSGHTVGQILALLQELLVCINDLISGKAASFQGFGVPDVATLRGPYNERMAIYEQLKPSLEAQYKDYKKTIESRPKKNENWVPEAQEILKKIDEMGSTIRSMGGDAAQKILVVKQFLGGLDMLRKRIESDIAAGDKGAFTSHKSVFESDLNFYVSNAAAFAIMCAEFNESGKITKIGPLRLLPGLCDLAAFQSSYSGLADYVSKNGTYAHGKISALLYMENGAQLTAEYIPPENDREGMILLNVRIDGSNGTLTIRIDSGGKIDIYPPSGYDAVAFLSAYSAWNGLIPEKFGVRQALAKAKEKMDFELGTVLEFSQSVFSMLRSSPEFSSLQGFKLPAFEFCREEDMPLSEYRSHAAGCYIHDEKKILINYEYYSRTGWLDVQSTVCHEIGHALQYYRRPYWVAGYEQKVPNWINERATDIVSVDIMEKMGLAGVMPGVNGASGYSPSSALWEIRKVVGAAAFDKAYMNGDLQSIAAKFCMEKRGNADSSTLQEFYSLIFGVPEYNDATDKRLAAKLMEF